MRIFPIPILQIFRFFLNCLWKRANAILTGTYIRSTFITDQSEFMNNLQIGKQIGKVLDIPKRPQAPKHIFWDWDMNNLETRFHFWEFRKIWKMLMTILCRMDQTLFQTSSRGSELKQHRFGKQNQKHCKNAVII